MQCAKKKNVVSLIRSDENHAATSWEAPDILSAAELQPAEPEPTPEEIALQQAYEEGLAKGHAEGFEKGKQEGIAAGHAEGLQQAEEQGNQQQEAFKQQADEALSGLVGVITALQNPLESQLDETVNQAIATLVTQISRQVVQSELSVQPEHIVGVVNNLFQELPMTDRKVHFHLHPEDKALLESGVQLSSGSFDWSIEADEQITRGGCHVESRNFSVDHSVEQRVAQEVKKVFGFVPEESIAPAEDAEASDLHEEDNSVESGQTAENETTSAVEDAPAEGTSAEKMVAEADIEDQASTEAELESPKEEG